MEGLQQTQEENAASTPSTTHSSCPAAATSHCCNASRQTSTVSTQTDVHISGLPDSFIKERKEVVRDMKESSSVVHEASEQQSTHEVHVPGSVLLPIITRGLFFSDSFFEKTWEDFHEAVRDVMSKWGDPACPADDLTHYRSLREQNLREENLAVKFTEDGSFYKIVVDVQDFMKGGNVAVRLVQDRKLAVEGHVERQSADERYKQQFHRRFVLPRNIYSESVSSAISADGVLTITAAKKPSAPPLRETIIPIGVEEGVHWTESLSHISEESVKSQKEARTAYQQSPVTSTACIERSPHRESLTENYSSDSSGKVASSRERIIPVMLEEQKSHSGSRGEVSTSSLGKNTQSTRQSLESSHAHAVNCTTTTTVSEIHTASKTQSSPTAATQGNAAASVNSEGFQVVTKTGSRGLEGVKDNAGGVSSVTTVPISLKGDFFSDSSFEDTRKQFTSAVQDVLQMSDAASASSDEMASYRSHLRRNPRLENQAVHEEEDTLSFKVVLDVHEFVGGELKVEVEDGRALVVEGQASCEGGASSSTLTFKRIFSLPSQADVAAINSALSSDGVLTIFTPKLQRETEFAADDKMTVQGHSRREDHSASARAWDGQLMRQVTEPESSFSETYSSSSSSNSSNSSSSSSSSSNSSAHQEFSPQRAQW